MVGLIEIQPQIWARRVVTILDTRKDFRELIDEDMGMEAADLFDRAIAEAIEEMEDYYGIDKLGDDYEAIADGQRRLLVDVMNELHEIISQKRLNRNRLEQLYERLNKNL